MLCNIREQHYETTMTLVNLCTDFSKWYSSSRATWLPYPLAPWGETGLGSCWGGAPARDEGPCKCTTTTVCGA
jgi:hypothetical protein